MALPGDYLLTGTLEVNGYPVGSTDRDTVRQYEKGELLLLEPVVYYESTDESGNRVLAFYPELAAGTTVSLEYVYEPIPLSSSEPSRGPSAFPTYWHSKLRYFAQEIYYETVEDNEELAEINRQKGDQAISDLTRYDNERQVGEGVFQVGILGETA